MTQRRRFDLSTETPRRLFGAAMAAFVAVSACGAVAPTDAERQESVKMNAETPSAAPQGGCARSESRGIRAWLQVL